MDKRRRLSWLLGSEDSFARVCQEMKTPRFSDEVLRARTLQAEPSIVAQRGDGQLARIRRQAEPPIDHRQAPRIVRALRIGTSRECQLSRARFQRPMAGDPNVRQEMAKIETRIAQKTKNKV